MRTTPRGPVRHRAPGATTLPSLLAVLPFLLVVALAGCESDGAGGGGPDTTGGDAAVGDTTGGGAGDAAAPDDAATPDDVAGGEDTGPAGPPPLDALASCSYVNPFSQGDECKAYTGASWTVAAAEADCAAVFPGQAGTFVDGGTCGYDAELGRCLVAEDGETGEYVLVSAGADDSECALAQAGCEVFGGGSFTPGGTCEGSVGPPPTGGGYGETPFVQPYLECRDPLPGEPPGASDGEVCTWTLISACTEPGRRYDDYASCEDVYTQRPYYGAPIEPETAPDDPRLENTVFLGELDWVRQQVEACACICCHSTRISPDGPSYWYVEADPIWIDSVPDSGLAMLAGLAPSDALGTFPPEDNNGFDRTALGMPTTDVPRMRAFLMGEWERRGYTPEDGAQFPAFGGPIVDQQRYEPGPCEEGEGVAPDGTLTWTGGAARYVYVLAPDAANPGVPPDQDEPEGTLWFVDVPTAADALEPGFAYGAVAGDMNQRIPADGAAPPALADGETYYVYVLRDIGFPLTRCLFTYEAP